MTHRLPLSVIVTTLNEAHNIQACLASVKPFARELIVVDAGSRDRTIEIARDMGAITHVTPDWPGFGPQKNFALSLATQPWVLSIDADERVPDDLAAEITATLQSAACAGYAIPRLSQFCGRWIQHSGWRPDYVLRLFRRDAGRFSDHQVHERVIVDGAIGNLHASLLHYSTPDLHSSLDKTNRYSTAAAQSLFEQGKRASLAKAIGKGVWAFIRTYVLRAGFLDGQEGFILAVANAEGTYYRYLKLALMHRAQQRKTANSDA